MFAWLEGKKTYIAAAGMFGLAVYKLSEHDWAGAWLAFSQGLAAAGIRHAISQS